MAEDIILLNGMTSEAYSTYAEVISTLLIGVAISFYFSWSVTLVSMAAMPLIMVGIASTYKLSSLGKGVSSKASSDDNKGEDAY